MMNKGDRGITFPDMDMKMFNDMVNLPPAQSPLDPDNILIDSGLDISMESGYVHLYEALQTEAVHACGKCAAVYIGNRCHSFQFGVICG